MCKLLCKICSICSTSPSCGTPQPAHTSTALPFNFTTDKSLEQTDEIRVTKFAIDHCLFEELVQRPVTVYIVGYFLSYLPFIKKLWTMI